MSIINVMIIYYLFSVYKTKCVVRYLIFSLSLTNTKYLIKVRKSKRFLFHEMYLKFQFFCL